jgi:predicted SnoaL-like aldol condensation-catalyzing enzyme
LASNGLYVPSAGRVSPCGHHNIAWEFTDDVRFDPNQGTFTDLLAELSSVGPLRACVSSEDLEYLYLNPSALRTLRSRLNESGYAVKVLFYLRPQAEYAESVYAESVRHGFSLDFLEFLARFVSAKQSPISNYSVLLDPFADVFGADNLIVRRFRNSSEPNQIVIDFLSQMLPDFDIAHGNYRVGSFRENVSIPFSQIFQLFLRNNMPESASSVLIDPVELAKSVDARADGYQYLSGPFDPVDLKDIATKFWKLGLSNLIVLWTYRVFIPVVSSKALREDIWTFMGFDSDGKGRKLLIKAFLRTSDRFKALMAQNGRGSSEVQNRQLADEASAVSLVEHAGENVPRYVEHLVLRLREEIINKDGRIERLSNELVQRESELRRLRVQLENQIARQEQEPDRIEEERIRLTRTGLEPRSSNLRQVFKALRSLPAAGYSAAQGLVKNFRRRKFARFIAESELFDSAFYLQQKPELKDTGIDPLDHFLEHGIDEGTDPHPLFDTSYYLEQNPDVVRIRVNPLLHFIIHGSSEGRDPHPLFDTSYYLEHNPDVTRAGDNALVHFIRCGAYQGRNPSPLFDVSHYLQQNPHVASSGKNPLVHFIQVGACERRNPHPLFDTSYYLEENADVETLGLNPLIHFLRYGALEGRQPHPLFDVSYYRQHNPDIEGRGFNSLIHFMATVNPLVHFIHYGVHEKRDPHPLFDTSYYLEKNPDVARAGLNPLIHFIQTGAYEGRDPAASFNIASYLQENPEVAEAHLNPLIHFVVHGKRNRPRPSNGP